MTLKKAYITQTVWVSPVDSRPSLMQLHQNQPTTLPHYAGFCFLQFIVQHMLYSHRCVLKAHFSCNLGKNGKCSAVQCSAVQFSVRKCTVCWAHKLRPIHIVHCIQRHYSNLGWNLNYFLPHTIFFSFTIEMDSTLLYCYTLRYWIVTLYWSVLLHYTVKNCEIDQIYPFTVTLVTQSTIHLKSFQRWHMKDNEHIYLSNKVNLSPFWYFFSVKWGNG